MSPAMPLEIWVSTPGATGDSPLAWQCDTTLHMTDSTASGSTATGSPSRSEEHNQVDAGLVRGTGSELDGGCRNGRFQQRELGLSEDVVRGLSRDGKALVPQLGMTEHLPRGGLVRRGVCLTDQLGDGPRLDSSHA